MSQAFPAARSNNVAHNQTRRLKPHNLKSDRSALTAIRNLPDYTPSNPIATAAALAALSEAKEQAHEAEIRARQALSAARNAAVAAEWALHNALLQAKIQIIAQYGDDSDAVAAVGLKKRSERRRPIPGRRQGAKKQAE
jgi:hypothetical protein